MRPLTKSSIPGPFKWTSFTAILPLFFLSFISLFSSLLPRDVRPSPSGLFLSVLPLSLDASPDPEQYRVHSLPLQPLRERSCDLDSGHGQRYRDRLRVHCQLEEESAPGIPADHQLCPTHQDTTHAKHKWRHAGRTRFRF